MGIGAYFRTRPSDCLSVPARNLVRHVVNRRTRSLCWPSWASQRRSPLPRCQFLVGSLHGGGELTVRENLEMLFWRCGPGFGKQKAHTCDIALVTSVGQGCASRVIRFRSSPPGHEKRRCVNPAAKGVPVRYSKESGATIFPPQMVPMVPISRYEK